MLLSILFILFISGITFIFGLGIGARTERKSFYQKLTDQQYIQLGTSDIVRVRSNKRITSDERKALQINGGYKMLEWQLARELTDLLLANDLIRKKVEHIDTAESFQMGRGPDTIYTYDIRVVHPDIISTIVPVV